MSNINFLPWRIFKRVELKRKFILMILGTIGTATSLVMIGITQLFHLSNNQLQRNERLRVEIERCNVQIEELKKIMKFRDVITARLRKIEELQKNSILSIHLFDELYKIIPENIQLMKIQKNKNKVILSGQAKSQHALGNMMRAFGRNKWLANPKLAEIKNSKSQITTPDQFKLNIELKFYNS